MACIGIGFSLSGIDKHHIDSFTDCIWFRQKCAKSFPIFVINLEYRRRWVAARRRTIYLLMLLTGEFLTAKAYIKQALRPHMHEMTG
jgi:hypothetical protein